ncbi:hypothetical protein MTR_8g027210 [Medicago truncatula]|uniref:Uncharacterized protein n=1 Tax=Medicago truncatula TaxID=3880 RepID=G7LAV2_MEDTR|nr:hypothetical protein MTR_8g027210 [Medicago truncatula]
MFDPAGEVGGEAWGWRRRLRVWEEEMLEECRQLLNGVVLQPNIFDRWLWDSVSDGGYTVRGVYEQLTTQADPQDVTTGDLIWHKQVPLKVSIFVGAWKSLRHTYFFIAPLSVHCGIISGVGSEYQVLTPLILATISFSLLTLQVTQRLVNPSFNLFGYIVSGWFRTNVTTNFITISKPPLNN